MIDQNIRTIIRKEINTVLSETGLNLNQIQKHDGSWVTDVDHRLTETVEAILRQNFPGITIVSEEGAHELNFPCFILDPVDGTAGLLNGTNECSLSLAFMPNENLDDADASGYIAHLFSEFEVNDLDKNANKVIASKSKMKMLVSRSEWKRNMFANLASSYQITPMGSIALKLAHLAAGNTNCVVTLKPKSIWDIAAGSILLHQRGMHMFNHGELVNRLDELKWEAPMIWGTKSDVERVMESLR